MDNITTNGTYLCPSCGKRFSAGNIIAGKCESCYKAFMKRRKALEKEGFFDNMNKLGSWKANGKRGKK